MVRSLKCFMNGLSGVKMVSVKPSRLLRESVDFTETPDF